MTLLPFQRKYLRHALAPGINTAGLSIPRANGKTFIAGHILEKCLTPTDPLFVEGAEYLLCAASIEQSRLTFRFTRQALEPTGEYRWLDSVTRIGAVHLPTNTRLRVLSSNGKTGMGIVNCPVVVCDEPGSWETVGGELMHDAIETAKGKPGSPLRTIYVGTLAPAKDGWWHDLIKRGSHGRTYIQSLQGNPELWDDWKEIKRVNPLTAISADFRRTLREELAEAQGDTRLKARFMSYRLNLPTQDESSVLLTRDDWDRMAAREVPPRDGKPIFSLDLGGGRAWSAATAVWTNGRVEALAVAPGIPDIAAQERRDLVPSGTYAALVEGGQLILAEGLQVPPPRLLVDFALAEWGAPLMILCDNYNKAELEDATRGIRIIPRLPGWKHGAEDVRATRKLAKDGPLAIAETSRPLLFASLSAATVESDKSGNSKIVKRDNNNQSRDDVAVALSLGAGELARRLSKPRARSPLRALAV